MLVDMYHMPRRYGRLKEQMRMRERMGIEGDIRKRDGRAEAYDGSKITAAMGKAFADAGVDAGERTRQRTGRHIWNAGNGLSGAAGG